MFNEIRQFKLTRKKSNKILSVMLISVFLIQSTPNSMNFFQSNFLSNVSGAEDNPYFTNVPPLTSVDPFSLSWTMTGNPSVTNDNYWITEETTGTSNQWMFSDDTWLDYSFAYSRSSTRAHGGSYSLKLSSGVHASHQFGTAYPLWVTTNLVSPPKRQPIRWT